MKEKRKRKPTKGGITSSLLDMPLNLNIGIHNIADFVEKYVFEVT
jgi:hypothetical protein